MPSWARTVSEAEAAQLILCPSKHFKCCSPQSTWRILGGSQEDAPEPISRGRRAPAPTVPGAGVETKRGNHTTGFPGRGTLRYKRTHRAGKMSKIDLNQCPGSRGGGKGSSGKSTSGTDTARASCLPSTHFKPPEGWAGSSGQEQKPGGNEALLVLLLMEQLVLIKKNY